MSSIMSSNEVYLTKCVRYMNDLLMKQSMQISYIELAATKTHGHVWHNVFKAM